MIGVLTGYKPLRFYAVWLGISLSCSGCTAGTKPVVAAGHTAAEVLLVFNADSPVSSALAKDYAAKRGVTKTIAIHCADSAASTGNETISLANYNSQIAGPVGLI